MVGGDVAPMTGVSSDDEIRVGPLRSPGHPGAAVATMGVPADDASAAADAQRRARRHNRYVRDNAVLSPDLRSARGPTRAEYNREGAGWRR